MSASEREDPITRRRISEFPVTNISNFVSTKVNCKNYFVWRHQFETILQTLDLESYVDSFISPHSSNAPFNGRSILRNPKIKLKCVVFACHS